MIWWLITGLLLLASLFLVYPFVGHKRGEIQDDDDTNLQIFRDQQTQLDSQLQQQEIKQPQYDQLLAEAKQLLLINSHSPKNADAKIVKKVSWLLPVMLLLMPIFCLATYHYLGLHQTRRYSSCSSKILSFLWTIRRPSLNSKNYLSP